MASVVVLRAVNVGRTNRCSTAAIAKALSKFGVVNIGAVGTFVVPNEVSESTLRAAFVKQLGFKCELMICPAEEILALAAKQPFAEQATAPDIVRFVNILHNRLSSIPPLPITLPSDEEWLLKVIAVEGRCVLGVYRRHMKAIRYLGKLEKLLGQPSTNRNWNTVDKIVKVLQTTAR